MITVKAFGIPLSPTPRTNRNRQIVGLGSKEWERWRDTISAAARLVAPAKPIDVPVLVHRLYCMPRPTRPSAKLPGFIPDLDKLNRASFDGLQFGGVLKNDSRIVGGREIQVYTKGTPGVMLMVYIAEEHDEVDNLRELQSAAALNLITRLTT